MMKLVYWTREGWTKKLNDELVYWTHEVKQRN